MIVLTYVARRTYILFPGDRFQLTIHDKTSTMIMIDEEITQRHTINFVASFRFALDDGTCPGFHLTGIFANSAELPIEIQNAIAFEDLPEDKRKRFLDSIHTRPYTAPKRRGFWPWSRKA